MVVIEKKQPVQLEGQNVGENELNILMLIGKWTLRERHSMALKGRFLVKWKFWNIKNETSCLINRVTKMITCKRFEIEMSRN